MYRNYGEFRPATISSIRDEEMRFPMSPAVEKSVRLKTLPKIDQQNLEVPFEVLSNLNFGRIKECHGSNGGIPERMRTPLAPPPNELLDDQEAIRRYAAQVADYTRSRVNQRLGMDRFFQTQEQSWKCIVPADYSYDMSFVDFVPPGMKTEPRARLQQEFSFRPPYEKALFDRRDQNFYQERIDPRYDTEAREFVHANTQQRVCWGGCTERQIRYNPRDDHFCCSDVRRNHYLQNEEIRSRHEKNVRNQVAECPRNNGIYASISTLSLDRKVPLRNGDNQEYYIHVFKFEPLHSEHRTTQSRVLNSRSSTRKDFSPTQLHNLYVSDVEFGVLGTDSGLQMSLDDHKKQLIMSERQRFITPSRAYQDDKMRFLFGSGVVAPPIANPTQTFHFGAFRLRNINMGRWLARVHPTLTGLPITHKSNKNLCLYVCFLMTM